MVVGLQIGFGLWVVIGLLIGFSHGFGAEFQWWIMVGSVWWAVGCGGTVGLGLTLVGSLGGSGGFAWCFL